jgi:hypothetical protein
LLWTIWPAIDRRRVRQLFVETLRELGVLATIFVPLDIASQ